MTTTSTIANLQSFVSQGESLTLEFKMSTSEIKDLHNLKKNIHLIEVLGRGAGAK